MKYSNLSLLVIGCVIILLNLTHKPSIPKYHQLMPLAECRTECLFTLNACCSQIVPSFPLSVDLRGKDIDAVDEYENNFWYNISKDRRCIDWSKTDHLWYHPGCYIKNIPYTHIHTCMEQRLSKGEPITFIFIGDSQVRNRFSEFLNLTRSLDIYVDVYNGTNWDLEELMPPNVYRRPKRDMRGRSKLIEEFKVLFYWEEDFHSEERLHMIRNINITDVAFVVLGIGPWLLLRNQTDTLPGWMKKVSDTLQPLAKTIPVIWQLNDPMKDLPNFRNPNVNTPNLVTINYIVQKALKDTDVHLWDTTWPMALSYIEKCRMNISLSADEMLWWCYNPVHHGFIILEQYVQLLMNLVCYKYIR